MALFLFATSPEPRAVTPIVLGPGAALLPGFALATEDAVLVSLARVIDASPLRNMETPGGHRMSVAMTNCGSLGWVSDRSGYRYVQADPATGKTWPTMPEAFVLLATLAAERAGYPGFIPNACLLNRYEIGTKLNLHQDRNEGDFTKPIVSVSLGLPATFLFGGERRTDPVTKIQVQHGDVAVWGGQSRLRFHGVAPIKRGEHIRLGSVRYNITFRFAG
ncbi:DNA oxidative demethylase AlkB [Terriglobus roseus]|uniref:DNA-N1-methyladenine dioxygenase n=1 Tax=Terriglobus roseus TaxID=392734 RepID=A0A1H4LUG2_9BACT|nr:DNA oxidative demethylase AlkB [Terriglobus roseus]SEB73872.1 DNA-N1-methyladenine dioxygenase [Terriglobus roseus]